MFAMCFGSCEINCLFLMLFVRVTQVMPVFSPVFQWHRGQWSPGFLSIHFSCSILHNISSDVCSSGILFNCGR